MSTNGNEMPQKPIAIIGMGMRLPGGISTPDDFWSLLVNKKDGKCRVPSDRYNVDGFHGEKTHKQNVATQYGYFLDNVNIKSFDANFFSARRREVEVTDPQQRLLLEVVWECMESAGQTNLRGSDTGVFVGVFGEDWHNMLHIDHQVSSNYRVISAGDYILANRLSYEFDLRGPSMTVRTACSASMTGLHLACQALRDGDCKVAIVAGSSMIMDPSMTMDMSEQGVLSPNGECKTFDADADGFARGEAVNAVMIKALDEAIRDGDPIRAVIRSTAVNSDGRTSHMGSPSTESQVAMIEKAYQTAGISDFSQTAFVECHGTGTAVGDPLEVAAIGTIFGQNETYIGSVKPNLGHGEGASGITSLIKAVLALENETIPPNIRFHKPNPKIPWAEYKLTVPTEPMPWPAGKYARVSVNSFGIGGANAHAILDSAASFGVPNRMSRKPSACLKANGALVNGHKEDSINTAPTNGHGGESDDTAAAVTAYTNGITKEGVKDLGSNGVKKINGNGLGVDSPKSVNGTMGDVPKKKGTNGHDASPKPSKPQGDTNGTNVEVDKDAISSDASDSGDKELGSRDGKEWPRLLVVSASDAKAVQKRAEEVKQYAELRPGGLNDLAHTLSRRRVHLQHRSFSIAREGEPIEFGVPTKVTAAQSDAKIGIAYVFTGQGAQWFGMGQGLIRSCRSFRQDIQEMDLALKGLSKPSTWSLEDLLCSNCEEDAKMAFAKAEFAQPLCTAVQVALVNLLKTQGIVPNAVIGHSSGEIAASYAVGALNMSQAITCAYLRGFVMKKQTRQGSMAAVGLGRDAVSSELIDGVTIACENSPKSITISGDSDAVDRVLENIKAKDADTFTRKLNVDRAYHSKHMQEIGDEYEEVLNPYLASENEFTVPFYSTVSGKLVNRAGEKTNGLFGPAYWRSNLESPVLFHTAMRNLLNSMPEIAIVLEVGPHSAMQGPLRQLFQDRTSKKNPAYVSALVRKEDAVDCVFRALGQLYANGYELDFSLINDAPDATTLTDLPNYPWDHSTDYWKESRLSHAWRFRDSSHHELLGSRCLETKDTEPAWRNLFYHTDAPWLQDHRVGSNVVFPCAGYIAMMGEAVRQILGSESYILRNLMVKSALMLQDNEVIEIMTTMKPARLTELSSSSVWYDISISTFNGTVWSENCIAQGRAGSSETAETLCVETTTTHPRKISEHSFYERMNHMGIKYGPRFQGLKEIVAHTEKNIATASIRNDTTEQEAPYAAHPTTIDLCLQLGAVASCKGIARSMDVLKLPVDIRRITICPGGPDLVAESTLDISTNSGKVVAVTKDTNQLVVKLENGRSIPFDIGENPAEKNALHAARIEWLPDIDCLEADDLMRQQVTKRSINDAIERVGRMSILQTADYLSLLEITPQDHLSKYADWLRREKQAMLRGGDVIVAEVQAWARLDVESRQPILDSLLEDVRALGDKKGTTVAEFCYEVCKKSNVDAIFTGKLNPVELFMVDDRLANSYGYYSEIVDISEFLRLCGHSQPTLNVLEIGAGTAGTTEIALKALQNEKGDRMYGNYTFTDVSAGFFASAKEKFKDRACVEYKVLDIEKDVAEQGFEPESFDLIIAANVLHATTSLSNSLKNVRSLLRPGGRLYLQELISPLSWRVVPFMYGLLPGWWVGAEDGRVDEPFVSVERWNEELVKAGFKGTETTLMDDDAPFYCCAHITTTAVATLEEEVQVETKTVTFIYKGEKHEFAESLGLLLSRQGVQVEWAEFNNEAAFVKGRDMIWTIDLAQPLFDGIGEEDYQRFMDGFLSNMKEEGMLWLMPPAQIGCHDPRYGLFVGLARTIRVELSIPLWLVELDRLDDASAAAVASIFQKFTNRPPLDRTLDTEYSIREGIAHVGRYHWLSVPKELESELEDRDPKQMIIGQYGMLDSLHWVQQKPAAVHDNDVELDIRAVGLNFRDIMIAMGILEGPADILGFEASGVVTRAGSAVSNVKVGDRVFAINSGLFSTRKVVASETVLPIPDGLTFEEAVTLPIVYLTVIYAIINLGQMEAGESILIHSATGGVGQAAINLCQKRGIEIYATVGSEEKVTHLVENFNIPRERIFHSRNASFVDGVMAATGGRGVDVVLNSLSGDLLHASWQCVAKCGKMMEIGKRDIMERGHLPLDMFDHNRTFYGIDLKGLMLERPRVVQKLMKQLEHLSSGNDIKPIQPIHTFPAQKINEAFRFMKKGAHIGKIVITIPPNPADIVAVKAPRQTSLCPDSTYFLVGGLGGLGKPVATWMVESGARSLLFLSRSAGKSDQDQAFIRELKSQGCVVTVVSGSAAETSDVKRALEAAPTRIAGVLHMTMVLRDNHLLEIGYKHWMEVQDPKVKATWNLHNALLDAKLDFFIMFSSLSGAIGHPGQANYASSNTFLDSFVPYRHKLGLPCSAIVLGGVEGIGYLSTKPSRLKQYRNSGLFMLQEQHLVEAIQVAMQRSDPSLTQVPSRPRGGFTNLASISLGLRSTKPLSDPSNRAVFKGDPRIGMYNNMELAHHDQDNSRDDHLRELLDQVDANPELLDEPDTLERASWEIGKTLFGFLLLPEDTLDIEMTLVSIGVDSLVSIEIRNWWRRTMGTEVTVLEIMNAGTIKGLGRLAMSSLKEKHGVAKTEGGAEANSSERSEDQKA